MLPFFFPLCLLFQRLPVARFAQRRPLLVGSGPLGIALVVMAVGRLLHRKIEPVARVRVGPDLHHAAREQMALLGRDTIEHAVDHRGGLGTGDVALGAERAVGIARDPAVARGEPDVRLRPVARDVREAALALVELGEQRDDLCHLRARDGRVGSH